MLQSVYQLMKSHRAKHFLTFYRAGLHQSPCRSTEIAPELSRLLEQFMMSQDVDGHLPKHPMDYTSQIFDCLCSGIRQQHDQNFRREKVGDTEQSTCV